MITPEQKRQILIMAGILVMSIVAFMGYLFLFAKKPAVGNAAATPVAAAPPAANATTPNIMDKTT